MTWQLLRILSLQVICKDAVLRQMISSVEPINYSWARNVRKVTLENGSSEPSRKQIPGEDI